MSGDSCVAGRALAVEPLRFTRARLAGDGSTPQHQCTGRREPGGGTQLNRPDGGHGIGYPRLNRHQGIRGSASRRDPTRYNYVRDTIYLATILFLMGISGHFRFFRIRLGLIVLGGLMLIVASVEMVTSPPIP